MDSSYQMQVKGSLQGAGICAQICAGICGLATCAVAITFTVYLGIFAFDNPNGDGWFGTYENYGRTYYDMASKADWDIRKARGVIDYVENLDHVHDHFVTWFTWGFINACGQLGALMLICIPCCPPVLGCFQCSSMAWWIAGMVWRLRESGAFASGDIISPAYESQYTEEAWLN